MKAMRTALLCIAMILFAITNVQAQEIPKPVDFFGFEPGADHMLFNYDPLIEYLQELEKVSDRIELREIGVSPMGKPMYICLT